MPIDLYPNIAKVKRGGVFQNLPGFVQQSGDADIKAMIANSESSTTAQYVHPEGSYFILNDVLYKAIINIAVNDTIAVGTNCEVAVLCNDVSEMESDVDNLKSTVDQLSVYQNVNLYNPNDPEIIQSKLIDGYGTLNNSTDFNVSGFIPILPNVEYEVPIYVGKIGVTARAIPIYDANKNHIQRLVSSDYSDTTKRLKFITTNPNARYVRVNVSRRGITNIYVTPWHYYGLFMLTKTPFPTMYYPYGEKEIFKDEYHLSIQQEKNFNPLIEETATFFGDSIGYGDDADGWAGRIGRNNRMTWYNASISGATFSKNNISACIAEMAVPLDNPDYIIFEGGTNDADRIGDATGEVKPEKFGTWSDSNYGTEDASTYFGFDITTFCGAVDYVCKKFVKTYPSAKIGYIAAQKMGTVDATRANRGYYIHTAMEICKKWGIPCLNLWDECHLNPLIPTHYTSGEDFMYIDGQHLTKHGYDYISPIVEAFMKTL